MDTLRKLKKLIRRRRQIRPLFYVIAGLFLAITAIGVLALSSVTDRAQAEPESAMIAQSSREEPLEGQSQTESPYRVLDTRVGWTATQLVVANTGADDWQRCLFEVDALKFGDGFQYRVDQLKAGERITMSATVFAKVGGEPYSLVGRIPSHFTIRCLEVAGKPGLAIKTATSSNE